MSALLAIPKKGVFSEVFAGHRRPGAHAPDRPVSADTGIKFSGKYAWRCWNLVETLRQICYTFKRQYHNGRRLALHGGTVTLRSHRDLYVVQKYMDKGGDTNDDYGRSACGDQPCADRIRTGIYHRQ